MEDHSFDLNCSCLKLSRLHHFALVISWRTEKGFCYASLMQLTYGLFQIQL